MPMAKTGETFPARYKGRRVKIKATSMPAKARSRASDNKQEIRVEKRLEYRRHCAKVSMERAMKTWGWIWSGRLKFWRMA